MLEAEVEVGGGVVVLWVGGGKAEWQTAVCAKQQQQRSAPEAPWQCRAANHPSLYFYEIQQHLLLASTILVCKSEPDTIEMLLI
jgi:hypothetical protein